MAKVSAKNYSVFLDLEEVNVDDSIYYDKVFNFMPKLQGNASGYANLYLSMNDKALQVWEDAPFLQGFVYKFMKKHSQAADCFQNAGKFALSGVEYEKSGDFTKSRICWENFIKNNQQSIDQYIKGLGYFNIGRVALKSGDTEGAKKNVVQSIRFLEEAADYFETIGRRERAFDCFEVIMAIGYYTDSFENLAEGYFNSIRILKYDNIKYYVIQYYEDFYNKALNKKEYHTGATIMQEAARFCERSGLPYSNTFDRKAAQAWLMAAEKVIETKQPAELAENALLAAIDRFNSLGDINSVKYCYNRLAALPLDENRVNRYNKIFQKFSNITVPNVVEPQYPDYLKALDAYPDIWNFDTIEWELNGDPQLIALEILSDTKSPKIARRQALLLALEIELANHNYSDSGLLEKIVERLEKIRLYHVLSPLESIYFKNDINLKKKIVSSIRSLPFKRSFVILNDALTLFSLKPDKELLTSILEAISGLYFPHALDQLIKIYHTYLNKEIKKVVLASIGKIVSPDSTEFLISVLRNGIKEEIDIVKEGLANQYTEQCQEVIRRNASMERGVTANILMEIANRNKQ